MMERILLDNGGLLSFTAMSKEMACRTENSAANAWNLNLSNGNMNNDGKSTNQHRVRAVSASLEVYEKQYSNDCDGRLDRSVS